MTRDNANNIKSVRADEFRAGEAAPSGEPAPALRAVEAGTPPGHASLAAWASDAVARVLGVDAQHLPADRSLVSLGLDSLAAAELAGAIESDLGLAVTIGDLLEGPSLAALVDQLALRSPAGGGSAADGLAAACGQAMRWPLSHGQRALLALDRRSAGGAAYIISAAVRVEGELSVERLRRALADLVVRHAGLRSHFCEVDGEAEQVVEACAGEPTIAGRTLAAGEAAEPTIAARTVTASETAEPTFPGRTVTAREAVEPTIAGKPVTASEAAEPTTAGRPLTARERAEPTIAGRTVTASEVAERVAGCGVAEQVGEGGAAGGSGYEWVEEAAAGWSAAQLDERAAEVAHRPFDLEAGPLLRVALFRCAADRHLLVLAVHHLVADFSSLEIVLAELRALYRGESLRPLLAGATYGAFVRRQAEWLAGGEGLAQAEHWRRRFAGGVRALDLPGDRQRPALPSWRGGARSLRLDAATSAALTALGRRAGATPFMTLLALYAVLLHRLSGADDFWLGTPAAGRRDADLEGVVGYFVNPVAVHAEVGGRPSFGELLRRLRGDALAAFAHQRLPFALAATQAAGQHDPSRSPIFQAMFVLYRDRDGDRGLAALAMGEGDAPLELGGGAVLRPAPLARRAAQMDLTLQAAEIASSYALALHYSDDLFDAATAARMLGQLRALAEALTATALPNVDASPTVKPAPPAATATIAATTPVSLPVAERSVGVVELAVSVAELPVRAAEQAVPVAELPVRAVELAVPVAELPLLAASEAHQLLVEWAGQGGGHGGGGAAAALAGALAPCLHQLFERRAARAPEAVALVCEAEQVSYGELNGRANRLARHLRRLGVGPEVRVALCLPRGIDLMVALLAILKAGGAYVPLDPGYPRERLRFVAGDALGGLAGAAQPVLVTRTDLAALFVSPDDAAPVAAPAAGAPTAAESTGGASTDAAARAGASGAAVPDDGAPPATAPSGGLARPFRLVLVDRDRRAFAAESDIDFSGPALPASLAYVIYTSGSTGRPKGVMVSHANVARLLRQTQHWYGFGEGDVWPLFHSAAFDVSVWEMWGALLNGGRLVVVPYWASRTPEAFYRLLAEQRVTVLNQTPSAFRQLIEVDGSVDEAIRRSLALRWVVFAGEAVDLAALRPWMERHGEAAPRLVNMYGITETTVHSTWRALAAADLQDLRRNPIGVAIPDLRLRLLDAAGQPVPLGVPGEIHVGGAGVARGYLARPDLTAARFVPDGWSTEPGARAYRSGDLARWRPDGGLDYLGRIDHQVKIRGFRVELGEIEAELAVQPGVRAAAVTLWAPPAGQGATAAAAAAAGEEARLIAYVVMAAERAVPASPVAPDAAPPALAPAAGAAPFAADSIGAAAPAVARLRLALAARLPEHMVPARFVFLEALPVTPSGKLDRRALPAPEWGGEADAAGWVAPRTAAEELVAGLFATLLGVERVGARDSFFALGGHSLLATRLVARARAAFGVGVELRQVFEHPTVEALARELSAMARTGAPAAPPLAAIATATPAPLSYAQERLWFLDRLLPGTAVYNLPGALHLCGPLDVAALAAGLCAIVRRHAVLRTVYPAAGVGEVRQQTLSDSNVPLPLVDLTGLGEAAPRSAWSLAALLARLPFDLERGPLLRLHLLRVGATEHLLVLALHHIVGDGWSVGIFLRELAALYTAGGSAAALPPLPISYADYARWQRAALAGERLAAELAHWRRVLAGAPPRTELPLDRPRPPVPTWRGARAAGELPPAALAALRQAARQRGATLFMLLLAAFDTLIARYTGRDDLVVGSPVANRERLETEGLIGCFVNSLALRVSLAGRPSAGQLVERVRQAALEALAHQEMPFEKLVEALAPERDLTAPPLFQLLLVLQNAAERPPAMFAGGTGGLQIQLHEISTATAKFDLSLEAIEAADGLLLTWEYSRDLFDAVTVQRFAAHFAGLLGELAGDPHRLLGELPLLGAADRQQLREWNDSAAAWPGDCCLHQLIERQVRATPAAVAVVDDRGASLTYAALNAAANRLARRLRRLGAGADTVVAICAERSVAAVAGLLAILKAGGAYLPLDPDDPADRLRFMRQDAGAPLLLAERRVAVRLGEPLPPAPYTVWLDDELALWLVAGRARDGAPAAAGPCGSADLTGGAGLADVTDLTDSAGLADFTEPASRDLGPTAAPGNLAYVIYTSGSTGRPKGTMNSHRGIVNRLLWMQQRYRLTAGDRVLQKTPFSFDVSVWELFWPLATGARLVMARPGGHRDPGYLLDAIHEHAITTLHFVPAMLAAFLAALPERSTPAGEPRLASLRQVLASGEALPHELQQEHAARVAAPLHNLYGPTEAAVDVTSWQTDAAAARRLVPIGRPVANTSIHLLDRDGQPVPAGGVGELYIGGVQVGRGYLNRPDLTAERFVPAPAAVAQGGLAGDLLGARLYRTGDLARHLADGAIDYLGRLDGQVKIRGLRVELGEIEAALATHPAVAAAAVALRPLSAAAGAPAVLVGYLIGSSASSDSSSSSSPGSGSGPAAVPPVEPAALRQHLAPRLPRHMLPAAFVWLEALPLTPSGKVDRRALPPPSAGAGIAGAPAAARLPLTPSEELVAACFGELLGAGAIGLDDDFFARGGHSLLATRLVSLLRARLGVELPLREVFETPTAGALARRVDALLASSGPGGPAGAATAAAAADAAAAAAPPPILPAPRDRPLPLSFAQQRLWFLDRLQPASPLYNLPLAVQLAGPLAVVRLRAALAALCARQQALRTVFVAPPGGEPCQEILPAARGGEDRLPLVDLAGLPAARRAPLARELAAAAALLPFDLARGPLFRARLLRLDAERHVLLLDLHHIVGDGWSQVLIVDEIAAAYGGASPRPQLPVQYADYAVWQRRWLQGEVLDAQLAWWRSHLAGAPAQLDLPLDRPRPAVLGSRGGARRVALDARLAAALRRRARAGGGTLFMTLLAAFQLLLARHSGQDDVVVGTPIANRTRGEIEGVVGMFANTLALRAHVAPAASFAELLAGVRETTLAAFARQDLPFEKLVWELRPERARSHAPLFQAMFALQPPASPPPPAAGVVLSLFAAPSTGAKFDLTLTLREDAGEVTGALEHSRDLFDPATAERLAAAYGHLLQAVAAGGSEAVCDLPLLGEAQRHQLLAEWGAGPVAAATAPAVIVGAAGAMEAVGPVEAAGPAGAAGAAAYACLHHGFADQARRTPDTIAVCAGSEQLSFAELDRRARRLARQLRRRGAGAGTVVGLCAARSPAQIAGLLSILMAGAAYLPLDPAYPPERLAFMAADAGVAALLHDGAAAPAGRLAGVAPDAPRIDLAAALATATPATAATAAPAPLAAPAATAPAPLAALAPLAPPAALAPTAPLDAMPEPDEREPLPDLALPAIAAYVIYTSGSTGVPKGVVVPHAAICNHMQWMQRLLAAGPGDAVLQRTTASFDASVWEIFLPLLSGARMVLLEPAGQGDAGRMLQEVARHGVTILQTVPALLALLCEQPDAAARCRSLRYVACGGETLSAELAARFEHRLSAPLGGLPLLNLYGPTEAAIEATWWRCRPAGAAEVGERGMPIGRPIDNLEAAVLDAAGRLAPLGAIGELHLGGAGLARGYLARPELTAARFVPDPRPHRAGGRLYRTGDLARFRADGRLEYCGRTDHQVKLRGYRIEIGEVEAALAALPGIAQAAVQVAAGHAGDRRLEAYVVLAGGAPQPDLATLRAGLRRRLPDFMVPAAFVALAELPRNAQGKLDRRALAALAAAPARGSSRPPLGTLIQDGAAPPDGAAAAAAPPRGAIEELVAGVWQEVLGCVMRPAPDDNFFELGGHSLLATQVASRLAAMLAMDLPLALLFEAPTLAGFAAAVEQARGGRPRPPIARAAATTAMLAEAGAEAEAPPLSYAQERLWFLDRLQPGQATYNMPVAFAARGELLPARFDAALSEVVRRHQVLRTRFGEAGERPVQHVDPPSRLRLPLVDLGALPGARRAAEGLRLARAEARRPFDLARGPLLRGLLLRRGGPAEPAAAEHLVLLNVHHIVSDGWSMGVLVAETGALYRAAAAGTPSPLPDLPVQYADFAVWQRAWLGEAELARQLAWWRRRLAGAPAAIELPTDRPRPPVASGRGGLARLRLGEPATADLAAAARQRGVTLFMALFAGCAALLARLGSLQDLVVGTPIANRHHLQTERMIGFFVNSLALRCDLGGDPTAGELWERVRETALAAYAHQDLPFERLVAELRPERLLSQNPIFQVMCALQNAPLGELDLPGLALAPVALASPTAKFDLALSWSETPGAPAGASELVGDLYYAADLFDAPTAGRLLGQLRQLLAGCVAGPERKVADLPLLGAGERHQLLCEWNASTWRPGPGAGSPAAAELVHAPFLRRAALCPAEQAVVAGERSVSYGELAALARQAAARLRAAGVGPERTVAFCAWPSIELVAAILGILQAGGAYLPLDPAHPRERLAQLLADAGPAVVVAEEATLDRLPDGTRPWMLDALTAPGAGGAADAPAADSSQQIAPDLAPDHPAYLLYTSGSTGTPKGVVVPHRAVFNRLRYQVEVDLPPAARVLQRARLGFDVSVIELFPPLWAGGTLVLAPPAHAQDAARLARLVVAEHITNLTAPPALIPALLAEPAFRGAGSLRRLVTGGDRVPADLPRQVAAAFAASPAPPQLWARYGPTEAAVSVSEWDCRAPAAGPTVPLGWPLAGACLYVLDHGLQAVPPGVPGELCIAGICLARGYHGRADLTAAAFVPDPHAARPEAAGGRMYRTGDLVRRRADGALEFLGRIDWQVKVRGFRIETGEIESVLARHPAVRQVAVLARPAAGAAAPAALSDTAATTALSDAAAPAAPPDAGAATAAGTAGDRPLQLVAYVVPRERDLGAAGERAAASAADHVTAWNALYEEVHPRAEVGDPLLNFAGWNSSYDGTPIPVEQMGQWADAAARRILSLGAPRPPGAPPTLRAVEIGCGSGLLVLRLAPHCASYHGVDFSRPALALLERRLARPGHELPQVTLTHALADRWHPDEAVAGKADLVILNSVVQYFPGVDYLVRVLRHAAAALAPGGRIFIGDVRSLDLAEALYTSIELAAAPDDLPLAELRRRVRTRRDDEEELLLAPAFWHALCRRLPELSHAQVWVKLGRAANELNGYRYDVVLTAARTRPAASLAPPPASPPESLPQPCLLIDGGVADFTLEQLAACLTAVVPAPDEIEVRGLLDRRLAGEAAALALLALPAAAAWSAGRLRREAAARAERQPGVQADDVAQLGAGLGYQVELIACGAGAAGAAGAAGEQNSGLRYTARLRRAAAAPHAMPAAGGPLPVAAPDAAAPDDLAALANNPLRGRLHRELAAELRRQVAAELPDYMVPAAFVVLDGLPMTAHGKLDRAALPEPAPSRQTLSRRYTEPRTPLEKSLAELWGELLGRDRIGVEDNFFELGGHSLLAVRLMGRLRRHFGRELPVAALFRADTVERLAALLAAGRGAAVTAALVELTPPRAAALPRRPFFCVHPAGGGVLCYTALARALGPRQPLYGLQLPDAETLGPDPSIEALAARYVAELKAAAPAGPYALGGWSLGGVIAYEMAAQLRAAGAQVSLLALIDPSPVRRNGAPGEPDRARLLADFAYDLVALAGEGRAVPAEAVRQLDGDLSLPRLVAAAHAAGLLPADLELPEIERLFDLYRTSRRALDRYRPRPSDAPMTLLLADRPLPAPPLAALAAHRNGNGGAPRPVPLWAALAGRGTEIESLPGDHYSIVRSPAVATLARKLDRLLSGG